MQNIIASVDEFQFVFEPIVDKQSTPWVLPFEKMDKSGQAPCMVFRTRGGCPRGVLCPYRHITGEKAKVCKHWLRGLCKKGDNCEFLHEFDLSRMPECHFFSTHGECNNGEDCLFLHIDPESKIKDCPWYARGFCKHGPGCRNRHARKVPCINYLNGFCLEGSDCPLAHPRFDFPGGGGDMSLEVRAAVAASGGIVCHKCGTPGHKAPQCTNTNARDQGIVCRRCHQTGHKAPQCPKLDAVVCFKCGEKGHYSSGCPNNLDGDQHQQGGDGGGGGGGGASYHGGGAPPQYHQQQQWQAPPGGGYGTPMQMS